MDIEALREKVSQINWEIAQQGLKTIDPKTGQQLMRYWLPEELKQLMIEEFNRPDEEKTHIAIVKYFLGSWTWWASEYEPRPDEMIGDFFGKVDGHVKALGYFNLRELREVNLRTYLWVERDYHFDPKSLSEC